VGRQSSTLQECVTASFVPHAISGPIADILHLSNPSLRRRHYQHQEHILLAISGFKEIGLVMQRYRPLSQHGTSATRSVILRFHVTDSDRCDPWPHAGRCSGHHSMRSRRDTLKGTMRLRNICLLALTVASLSAQEVINLYPGVAPGSEDWNYPE
jgi:hypothetical protein